MKFTPKSEEELATLLTPGIWDYEVVKAEDTTSKSGNQMLHLITKCWDENGKSALVHDYILESFDWKIRHFCYSNGLDKKYESGTLNAVDSERRSGKCRGGVEKDKTGQYGDKNRIVDYVMTEEKAAAMGAQQVKDLDDEIPF